MQTIVLNNHEYKISFNFGVIKSVCKDCDGITVPKMIEKLSMGDLELIGAVLYHGVKCNHPEFKMDEINKLSLGEVFSLFEVVGELMSENMPTGDGKKKNVAKKK